MQINGPNGQYVKVDEGNRLYTRSVRETMIAHCCTEHASAFSWTIVSYDYDAADTILLVRNDSTTEILYIDTVWAWIKTAGALLLHHPTADFVINGTTVVGVNLNTTSGVLADATAMADETGNTQGDILDMRYCAGAASIGVHFLNEDGVIALGYHDSLGLDAVAGGDECLAVMMGYYHKVI